jgi:hypothetical protein
MELCIEAAIALGAQDAERVRLRALQAHTAFWLGDFTKLFELGSGAMSDLSPGSLQWYWLANGLYLGHRLGGSQEEVTRLGQTLLGTRPEAEAVGAALEALCSAACLNAQLGARQESSALIGRFTELCGEAAPEAALERTWRNCVRSNFSFHFEALPWQTCLWAEQGYRGCLEVGLERNVTAMHVLWAHSLEVLGDTAGAEALLRESLAQSQQVARMLANLHSRVKLALLLADSSVPAQQQEALALVSGLEGEHLGSFSGLLHLLSAKVAAARGNLAEAEAQARKTCELPVFFLLEQLKAQRLLSHVLLTQGRAPEARQVAALGVQRLEQRGSECAPAVGLRLALAEACLAEGDAQAGEAALRRALQCLRTCARDIPDEPARERFLLQVPENARTLELARQRWGEAEIR